MHQTQKIKHRLKEVQSFHMLELSLQDAININVDRFTC